MRVVFVLLSLMFFIASRRPATAFLHGDRAGAFIGWHGEITRPTAHSSHLAQPYINAKGSDHQSTEVKHPSIAFETLVMRDHKPKPSHHASSICEVSSGQFLVAWFAGQFESKPDVGIYTARYQNGNGAIQGSSFTRRVCQLGTLFCSKDPTEIYFCFINTDEPRRTGKDIT